MSKSKLLRHVCVIASTAVLTFAPPTFAGNRDSGVEGAVFVLTNSTDATRGNEVVMFNRHADGTLDFFASYATGGLGSGPAPTSTVFGVPIPATHDGLGSQDGLILSNGFGKGSARPPDRHRRHHHHHGRPRQLFGVNGGSNSITCFVVTREGLRSRQIVDSGGVFPVSLTSHGNVLYVLNAGSEGNIKGFRVDRGCRMRELHNSTRSLTEVFDTRLVVPPAPSPAPNEVLTTPAQISFTPDGRQLVVAIKGGDAAGGVAVYGVRRDGRLLGRAPTVTAFGPRNNTAGPFGFTYDSRGNLLLNHANSFTFASYRVEGTGALTPISAPLPISGSDVDPGSPLAFGGFNCWVARLGDVAYIMTFGDIPATNGGQPDGPGIISAVRIAEDGDLSLLDTDELGGEGIVAIFPQNDRTASGGTLFGNHGIDLTTVKGEHGAFLYDVRPRTGRVGQFEINDDGTLSDLGEIGGLAEGVDPFVGTNPSINVFLERCFNQPEERRSPACALGSAQGIVGY